VGRTNKTLFGALLEQAVEKAQNQQGKHPSARPTCKSLKCLKTRTNIFGGPNRIKHLNVWRPATAKPCHCEICAATKKYRLPGRRIMIWLHDLSYFFGGTFLANAVPHYVSGVMGRAFQSPFAKPPGKGLSSSTVNVMWGFANLVIAYGLILRVGEFDLRATDHIASVGLGVLLMGVATARTFGRFHGGNAPANGENRFE
jgi:hypothetical protein